MWSGALAAEEFLSDLCTLDSPDVYVISGETTWETVPNTITSKSS